MINTFFVQGRALAAPLAVTFANVQTWLDGLLVRAEATPPQAPPEDQPKSGGFPVWAIVVIAALLILCLVPVCILAVLTLLGPAIGNVFSSTVDGI